MVGRGRRVMMERLLGVPTHPSHHHPPWTVLWKCFTALKFITEVYPLV